MKARIQVVASCTVFSSEPMACPMCGTVTKPNTIHRCGTNRDEDDPGAAFVAAFGSLATGKDVAESGPKTSDRKRKRIS